jgi:hypothetical protein
MGLFDESDEESEVTSSEPRTTADLDYYIVKYLLKCQRLHVRDIEKQNNVAIRTVHRSRNETLQISFVSGTDCADEEVKAREKFIELVMSVYSSIIQRSVHLARVSKVEAKLFRANMQKFCQKIYVDVDADSLMLTLVGPFEEVAQGENIIAVRVQEKEASKDLSIVGPADQESTKLDSLINSPTEHRRHSMKDPMPDEFRYTANGNNGQSVLVRVFTADITQLAVDAIVNTANSRLANYAGVAGEIERAGGSLLRDDCERTIARDGLLKVSKVQ